MTKEEFQHNKEDFVRVKLEFEETWKLFPRRTAKQKAWAAWKKLNGKRPPINVLLEAIEKQKQSRQWQEGIIPHLATWLNQHRWEDEMMEHALPIPEEPNARLDPVGWQSWYSAYGKRSDA